MSVYRFVERVKLGERKKERFNHGLLETVDCKGRIKLMRRLLFHVAIEKG